MVEVQLNPSCRTLGGDDENRSDYFDYRLDADQFGL